MTKKGKGSGRAVRRTASIGEPIQARVKEQVVFLDELTIFSLLRLHSLERSVRESRRAGTWRIDIDRSGKRFAICSSIWWPTPKGALSLSEDTSTSSRMPAHGIAATDRLQSGLKCPGLRLRRNAAPNPSLRGVWYGTEVGDTAESLRFSKLNDDVRLPAHARDSERWNVAANRAERCKLRFRPRTDRSSELQSHRDDGCWGRAAG